MGVRWHLRLAGTYVGSPATPRRGNPPGTIWCTRVGHFDCANRSCGHWWLDHNQTKACQLNTRGFSHVKEANERKPWAVTFRTAFGRKCDLRRTGGVCPDRTGTNIRRGNHYRTHGRHTYVGIWRIRQRQHPGKSMRTQTEEKAEKPLWLIIKAYIHERR